jgi:serine/threonine-protein kinase HipA
MKLGERLFVTLYGQKIGTIERGKAGAYEFRYLDVATPHPLSLSLDSVDLNKSLFSGKGYEALPHYFDSLLPEGWLLDIARGLTADKTSRLEILHLLCRDSFGAVSFETGSSADGLDLSEAKELIDPSAHAESVSILLCQRCAGRLPNRSFNGGFHEDCSIALFGTERPPSINVARQDLRRIAEAQLLRGESITGAQEKFSLKYKLRDKTIHAPGFAYIVKPKQMIAEIYDLPRTEQLLMLFAKRLGLQPADSALIKLRDGTDAFITKRFDRDPETGAKIHAEDFSQASGQMRGAEGRYNGSHELLAKTLLSPHGPKDAELLLDKKRLLGLSLMNFLFGNSDGHLKNHAILWTKYKGGWRFRLSPFYDLVPCRLYTKDDDELGLKICGKNRGLSRVHFDKWTSESLGLSVQEIDDFMDRVRSERSFILDAMRGYGLSEDRISGMMHLIATGMNQLRRGTAI